MGKKSAVASLNEWIESEDTKQRRGNVPKYKTWPEKLRDELDEVLRRMNAGAVVTKSAMVRRAEQAHGVLLTENQLDLYAIRVHGRRSWSNK